MCVCVLSGAFSIALRTCSVAANSLGMPLPGPKGIIGIGPKERDGVEDPI